MRGQFRGAGQGITRKLDGLIEAIAERLRSPGLQQKLAALDAQKAALEAAIAAAPPAPRLHPNLAALYRRRVVELSEALADPALRDEALTLLRALIEDVEITPMGKAFKIAFAGQIASMLARPSPAKASRTGRYEIAVKEVAGAHNQRYLHIVTGRIPRCDVVERSRLSFQSGSPTLASRI